MKERSTGDDPFACLHLATTVFQQRSSRFAYYGYSILALDGPSSNSGIYTLLKYHDKVSDVQFSKRGSEVVVDILRELGLNEQTTTAVELDELDIHFACTRCPPEAMGLLHK
ncbi:hypothetical protein OF83DRAFT_1178855 [Amylostereum chailletii]|nr:hypothetical protein OF83DRAFT_1178855 [Amylostereum chailletii]